MSFSNEEIEEFKVEANELLDLAEKNLMGLDQGEELAKCFDSIFRGLHNLKGGAGMMELSELQKHTHELETIFMSFKGKSEIPKNFITFFLNGIDVARNILDGNEVSFSYEVKDEIVETKNTEEPRELQLVEELEENAIDEFLLECDETVTRISYHLKAMENGDYHQELIDDLYREVHSLKGGAYLFSCTKLGDIAHSMESSLENIRNGTHIPNKRLIDCLYKSLEVIDSITQSLKMKKSDDAFKAIVPVIAKTLQHLSSQLELKTIVEIPEVEVPLPVIIKEVEVKKSVVKEKEVEVASSIRVPVSLLDNLMTLMGEMVLVRNQVLQYSNKTDDLEFLSMSKRLNVVTSEIQGEMMKTRMQPIGIVLDKFHRVVRDLSQDLKKQIEIDVIGSETELDKSLLESIKDPLTHIIRNSCDHGIETPEVRREKGKSEKGIIAVKSYHEGGQVVIEVNDDGKGLNREQIKLKAIEKGIITSAHAQTLSDKGICDLVFAPGFSTAAQVTNVSGRGVGMDVVKTNIEKIGGTVELGGSFGQGTNIKIKIPLTLAIIPALLVKCKNETFAIPQIKLEELVRVDPTQDNKIEFLHGTPVYRLRGQILPLVDMNKTLGFNSSEDLGSRTINIAVLNGEHHSFGVIIDEVLDTADIVVKPLNRLLKSLNVYSGATILGDGSIALIFDVTGISKGAQLQQRKETSYAKEEKKFENELEDFLVLSLNSKTKHVIALNYVQRLEVFNNSAVEYSVDQRVIRYRDEILPVLSVNELLGYPKIDHEDSISIIVIEKAGNLYGLEVNAIVDTLSTREEVHEAAKKHIGIFGNLNTADELIVVVDPFELIDKAFPEKQIVVNKKTINIKEEGKILLVEDTIYFRKAIKSALEKRGYEVITAGDGKEALEILNSHEHDFEVVVSDIEMPRLNGFEMAKKIRENHKFTHLPLLAISSKADAHFRDMGLKAGFDIYLEKLKADVLLAGVAELRSNYRKAA